MHIVSDHKTAVYSVADQVNFWTVWISLIDHTCHSEILRLYRCSQITRRNQERKLATLGNFLNLQREKLWQVNTLADMHEFERVAKMWLSAAKTYNGGGKKDFWEKFI